MKILHLGATALLVLAGLTSDSGASATPTTRPMPRRILTVDSMYGVDGPFVGAANAVRELPGDELPWVISSAKGWLGSRGRHDLQPHLKLAVRGLVFADDPSVPPQLVGTNDEATFRAVVSCLSEDAQGNLVTVNVTTRGFRASATGDCDIDADVDLPSPCVAPVVFVIAGSEDKWFAVTGFESRGS